MNTHEALLIAAELTLTTISRLEFQKINGELMAICDAATLAQLVNCEDMLTVALKKAAQDKERLQ